MTEHKNAAAMLDALGRVGNFAYEGGRYLSPCYDCGCTFDGAKLARQCLPCAIAALEARPAPATEGEVERVARAIYEVDPQRDLRFQQPIHWQDCTTEFQNVYRAKARAALSASRPSGEGKLRAALVGLLAGMKPDAKIDKTDADFRARRDAAVEVARAALSEQPETKEA